MSTCSFCYLFILLFIIYHKHTHLNLDQVKWAQCTLSINIQTLNHGESFAGQMVGMFCSLHVVPSFVATVSDGLATQNDLRLRQPPQVSSHLTIYTLSHVSIHLSLVLCILWSSYAFAAARVNTGRIPSNA